MSHIPRRAVVVDLEATCWEENQTPDRMEIIEIGAVLLHPEGWEPMAEFSRFVRPVQEPVLSEFCTRLTSIAQRDVDRAQTFPKVFSDFLAWLGPDEFSLCSWGAYDLSQIQVDCRRHGIPLPDTFAAHHLNLKKLFQEQRGARKACGMRQALSVLGIPLEGQHHRGIDDARNIAKIARLLLGGS